MRKECQKRYNDFRSALPTFTPPTVSNGQSPTPNQLEATKHEEVARSMPIHCEPALEAIDNMECGTEHNVSLAKCPVPDSRGGHHICMTAAEDADKTEEVDKIDDSQTKNA